MKPRAQSRGRSLVALITSAALVAALSGVVVSSSTAQKTGGANRATLTRTRHAPARLASRSTARAHKLHAVPERAREHFALFGDRRAQASSALSGPVAGVLATFARFGVNPDLTRVVQSAGGTVMVTPGNNVLCVVAERPGSSAPVGGTCSTEAYAEAGGEYDLAGEVGQPTLLSGLVPNGIDHVGVTLGDGSTETTPVVANTYSMTTQEQIVSVQVGSSAFEMPR